MAVSPSGSDRPTIVLDAGTGLRTLTGMLAGDAYHGSVLLSHLHWDHMQGLPFFTAGDRDDAAVTVDLAHRLDAHSLVLFHHAPSRTDNQLDEILSNLRAPVPVTMAAEGQVIEVAK